METDRLDINTGMDGFILLKGIRSVSLEQINGWACFYNATAFEAIEALAQLGAMHARFLCDFDRHAFLLKINHFNGFNKTNFTGDFDLQGKLVVKTQSAFTYQLTAGSVATFGEKSICSGEFSFAVLNYNQRFKQGVLKAHYRKVFLCLSNLKNE
ncbi:MAG: hypothetical protein ABIJ59_13735 [Pseudomonadota bacterium]